jgi:hypothetical protein
MSDLTIAPASGTHGTPTSTASLGAARVLELARFRTRPQHEPEFLASHAAAMRAIRAAYPGLASVMTVKLASTPEATTWVDVALWTSEEEARRAAAECMSIPEFAACAEYMEADFSVEHGEVVARY